MIRPEWGQLQARTHTQGSLVGVMGAQTERRGSTDFTLSLHRALVVHRMRSEEMFIKGSDLLLRALCLRDPLLSPQGCSGLSTTVTNRSD